MADYLKKIRDEGKTAKSADASKKERGKGVPYRYKPNKAQRKTRSLIWDRYTRMRDDPIRKEAELDWEQADKKMRLWRPERDPDDWRADLRLPDAFAAVQTHMQETIGMKLRPYLKPTEGSDTALAFWSNGIMTWNMDRTSFDLEIHKAMNCNAARGTAFTVEQYLYETRKVKNPTSVKEGILQYEEEEIIDRDDTFTKHWPNERVFIDEAADNIDVAEDCVLEERLRIDTFKAKYGQKDDFFDTEKVIPCGSVSPRTNYFDVATDMDGDYVQVLHYYNKYKDMYAVLANTVVVHDGPIPFKHKELPVSIWNYYPVEGRIYGMGIPKVISPLQEEREAIRNLSLDRQKMHLNKMFLVSDLFDLDEEEATTRPHGFIHVTSGGMNLDNVIKPLEYGDVPGSSIRMDDQLRDDEKRVTGIDDRSQGVNMGGTATEAAILTEQSQKRINLINTLTGMATIERIGKLKWSNIQFFYPAPQVKRISQGNKEREYKQYRKVSVEGKEFNLVLNNANQTQLEVNDITGTGSFELDPAHARFLDGDWDIQIQWDAKAVMPQAIRQSKVMDLFNAATGNPFVMRETNLRNAWKDVLMEFEIDPRRWMTDKGQDDDAQMSKAMWENQLMMTGEPLDPTEGASQMHTMVHMWFMETEGYKKIAEANPAINEIFKRHIMGEGEAQGQPGGITPPANAGMGLNPETAGMPPPPMLPTDGGPAPTPDGGQAAAPAQAPAAQPVVNGGNVTQETAPLR